VTVTITSGEVTPFSVAVIFVVFPLATLAPSETMPVGPTLAVVGAADFQETCEEMSAVVAFEYVPVAVRLSVVPIPIRAGSGEMAMLLKVAGAVGAEVPPQPASINTIQTTYLYMRYPSKNQDYPKHPPHGRSSKQATMCVIAGFFITCSNTAMQNHYMSHTRSRKQLVAIRNPSKIVAEAE
jgi:hypothetical protein